MSELWLAAAGGAVGAALRYLVDRAVTALTPGEFPWGTFSVNVVGTFLLGLLVGAGTVVAVPSGAVVLLSVGVCGALTTYSTFSYEIVALIRRGRPALVAAHAAATVCCGLAALALGAWVAGGLLG